jgi:intracellular septation protein
VDGQALPALEASAPSTADRYPGRFHPRRKKAIIWPLWAAAGRIFAELRTIAYMKFLFDLFPILLFFMAYKLYDIYVATAVAIFAALLQTGLFWLKHRKFEKMHVITLGILILFGGLTLALRDPVFIKWKPTVVNWLFGIAFIGSRFIGKRTLVERMMSHAITAPGPVWLRLNWAWVVFFFGMGLLNIYVAYNFSEDTWVNFKLFGMMGLTLLFVFGQAFYLSRYMVLKEENK